MKTDEEAIEQIASEVKISGNMPPAHVFTAASAGARRGIDYGRAHPRWRKVSEELPEHDAPKVWLAVDGSRQLGSLFFDELDLALRVATGLVNPLVHNFTHWTELPEGPEISKEQSE